MASPFADDKLTRRMALDAGFHDMTYDAKQKLRAGVTTFQEIERVHKSHRLSKDEREHV